MTGPHQAGRLLPPNLPAGPLVIYSTPHVAEARHTPSETSLGHPVVTFSNVSCGEHDQPDLCAGG